jgi:Flp pilus assembly protein TadD
MLETVHEFAWEQLAACGEAESVWERHAACYTALAGATDLSLLMSPRPLPWLMQLKVEHDNIRAALRWAIDHGAIETGMRLTGALASFWITRGYLSEGRAWCEAVLQMASGSPRTLARAQALGGAGMLAAVHADTAVAHARITESLNIWRERGSKRDLAYWLFWLGPHVMPDTAALAAGEEAVALFRELDDRWGLGIAVANLGVSAGRVGDFARAEVLYEESVTLLSPFGPTVALAVPLSNLGTLALQRGDLATARARFEESLPLHRGLGNNPNTVSALTSMAMLCTIEGDTRQAAELLQEGLMIGRTIGTPGAIAICLEALAGVAQARRQAGQAARILAATAALRERTGAQRPPSRDALYARTVAATREVLGDEGFKVAWDAGAALAEDHVVTEALAVAAAAASTG